MAKSPKTKNGGKEVSVTHKKQDVKQAGPGHIMNPLDEMESMFERLFPHGWTRPFDFGHPFWKELPAPFSHRLAPRVDVINREREIMVRAQLPGVEKKDLDVSISDNTLTIRGHTSHEEQEEKGDYYRRECSSGSFTRTFVLPNEVDGDKAKATFENGILELTIPKSRESKQHKIQID